MLVQVNALYFRRQGGIGTEVTFEDITPLELLRVEWVNDGNTMELEFDGDLDERDVQRVRIRLMTPTASEEPELIQLYDAVVSIRAFANNSNPTLQEVTDQLNALGETVTKQIQARLNDYTI